MAAEHVTQIPAPAAGANSYKLKEKIKNNIQKLRELAQKYDISASPPDFILTYLEDIVDKIYDNYNKMPEGIKEVLTLAADAIDLTIVEVVKYSKALGEAYDNDDVKGIVNNFTKLYADLNAIYALLRFIKKYMNVSYVIDALEEVIGKADNIKYTITKYLGNNVKLNKQAISELGENLKYFTELKNNDILGEWFDEIENGIETNIDQKRETCETLREVFYEAWDHMRAGLAFGSNADETLANIEHFILDLENIPFDIIEAYADFMILQTIYKYILSEYVRSEGFESALEKAINNVSNALNVLINHFS